MTYTFPWPELPQHIRSRIVDETFDSSVTDAEKHIESLNNYLQHHNAVYNKGNTISFETENHYMLFLLKWQ